MKSIRIAAQLFIVIIIVYILIIGKSIVLPLMFSILIYLLIKSLHRFFNKSKIMKKYFPSWLKNMLSAGIIFTALGFLLNTIIVNTKSLSFSLKKYEYNIHKISDLIEGKVKLNLSEKIEQGVAQLDLTQSLNPILNSISSFAGSFVLVLFYVVFLILEELNFKKKMALIITNTTKLESTNNLLRNIEKSITHYVGLKTLISFISALACFIVLFISGIQSPFLWATFIFVLNFIPVVGAFLAVSLPVGFAVIQFGTFSEAGILLLVLSTIQLVVGNLLEPKLMGNSLNISPLVAMLSLAVWGSIWGIIGMVLSVPITVILIIICAHFTQTRAIAILLSNKGEI
ncbi:MAG: AI-2E family transporter [Crocinitomicaceae bacterium]|nr:AI-2E family transporter [Crocinitomicaceae bacterium]